MTGRAEDLDHGQKPRRRRPIWNKISDFANVFKSFIGSNYLSVPFAFKQSGLILGIIGLVVIAYITDHCCVLIVKCKKAAIDQIMNSTYHCSYEGSSDQYQKLEKRKTKQRSNLESTVSYGDLGRIAMGRWGSRIVITSLIVTQFSACVNYFTFIGETIMRMWPPINNHTSKSTPNATALLGASPSENHPSAPDIIYLMLIPLPIFLLQTYVRKVRSLGPLSSIANACVFFGFFSILGFILHGIDFSNVHKIDFWKLSTFPIFFGQIVWSYEGIGTIIPVEASMKENRRNYRKYLHSVIILVSIIQCTFGVLGYIHFRDEVEQIISDNLPYGTLSIVVQVTLCIGILFTFPLQMFPVVEIAENYFLKDTRRRTTVTASYSCDESSLRPETSVVQYGNITPTDELSEDEISENDSDAEGTEVLIRKPTGPCSCDMGWSTWKRNIVRTILVCLSFGVAYVSRNYYAYVAALSGSIGSSLLAFILPCAFHLIIERDTLPTLIVAKDIILILFGIIAGIVGFVTTLIKIIK
ncbi:amino acid transporter AVT3B-like [Dendronephthya gigantea]|uniref:amino acid transporter AVT3B-like n=1 Tax=Dendronephthya gigantea TaxID=151771 RepID=UPI0010696902|nr:amino acid transporter AVT3B-like [Dendronephthya gigantea]